jgi:hypothetical protein
MYRNLEKILGVLGILGISRIFRSLMEFSGIFRTLYGLFKIDLQ